MDYLSLNLDVGLALGWVNYPDDPEEQGMLWHTDKDKAPFGPIRPVDSFKPFERWADAGPIIDENGISLIFDEDNGVWIAHPPIEHWAYSSKHFDYEVPWSVTYPDPLHAAMFCFLKMKK